MRAESHIANMKNLQIPASLLQLFLLLLTAAVPARAQQAKSWELLAAMSMVGAAIAVVVVCIVGAIILYAVQWSRASGDPESLRSVRRRRRYELSRSAKLF